MGIRFSCPNGHRLNVKNFLAGKRGVCPQCGAKFIIPMLTEEPATETRQPVSVGQSPSVDIVVSPAPSHQTASAAASPSVIIPVSDLDPSPSLDLEPVIRDAPVLPAAVPPATAVTGLPRLVTDAVVATPEPAQTSQRERSRRNQIIISLLLLALVVFLAGVLIWVLTRDASQTPAGTTTMIDRREFQPVFAIAGRGFFTSVPSNDGVQTQ
jgi:hypothetical protein